MLSKLIIKQIGNLPEDIRSELSRTAAEEGFRPIRWLIEDWEDETNRFSLPGEALYEVRDGNRLVGICGLNRDPFSKREKIGRLRRLYVLPEFRRKGVGRQLVLKVIEDAVGQFEFIRLMTLDDRSAQFFEAVGFHAVEGEERVSHIIAVDTGDGTIQ